MFTAADATTKLIFYCKTFPRVCLKDRNSFYYLEMCGVKEMRK